VRRVVVQRVALRDRWSTGLDISGWAEKEGNEGESEQGRWIRTAALEVFHFDGDVTQMAHVALGTRVARAWHRADDYGSQRLFLA
jgi:hypothetical protein